MFIENEQLPTAMNIRRVVRKDYTNADQFVHALHVMPPDSVHSQWQNHQP